MKIQELSTITDQEMAQLINVWESAVTATHHFLTKKRLSRMFRKPFVGLEQNYLA
ncbi:hypothetical protein FC35_GL001090 [Limosilactobacillus coleohominis DSM 14060]|nr:hypothetical protein FC35_GL001090 [Limosilactobacillus coleohominis DSM 14060]